MVKFSSLDLLFPLDVFCAFSNQVAMFHLTQQGRLAQCYTIPTRDGLQIMLLDFTIEIIRKYGFLIVIYLFYFN